MRATLSQPLARPRDDRFGTITQKAGGSIERVALISTRQVRRRGLVILLNLLVTGVVMSLPFIASAVSPHASAQPVASAPAAPTTGRHAPRDRSSTFPMELSPALMVRSTVIG